MFTIRDVYKRQDNERAILFNLQTALHEVGSRLVGSLTLKSLVPALEVVQTEGVEMITLSRYFRCLSQYSIWLAYTWGMLCLLYTSRCV